MNTFTPHLLVRGVLVIVATLSSLTATTLYGATHHVCDCGPGADHLCVPGSDSATGNSPLTPWKSFSKARQTFAKLAPGDTIAFCRGGSFSADGGIWVNNRCLADTPCVVTSYVPPWSNGRKDRALIVTPANKTAFSFGNGGNANHEEGYAFSHLEVRGANGNGLGFFLFNDITDVVLDSLVISGFDIGIYIAGSNPPNPGSNGLNERITVKNSRISDNGRQGLMGSCSDCRIVNNIFDNNGFRGGGGYHNLYWDGSAKSNGAVIAGNTLSRSAVSRGKCGSVSLVVHGVHTNLTIENNTVKEEVGSASEGCWGIAADTGYGTAESFSGLVIRGNTIMNVGNVGIGVNACTDCLVEGNTIVQGQPFSSYGIMIPDRARGLEDRKLDRVIVRNNTVTMTNSAINTGILLGGEGTGHVSAGNTVSYSGTARGWNCFSYTLPGASYAAVDNNTCRFPATANGLWEKTAGSLANWQRMSGVDLHSSRR